MTAKIRKPILLFLLFTYLSMGCGYSQSSTMFLYETEKGYTYVDKDFNSLINKPFKWAGRFFDGLAIASENGYVGYINTKGNFVIKPEFEYALPFHNGVAKVWKSGKPYIIDKKGKILFENNYRFIKYAIKDSFEPIFIATTQKWKCGVIDKNGKILVDTIYNEIRPFDEGLAIVVQNSWETGVIDLTGKIIVPFGKYSRIGDYNSSRAAVTSNEWDWKTIGFIDNKGNLVFKKENCDFDSYNSPAFSDGLVALRNSEYKDYVLMDTQGNKIYDSKHYISVLKFGYAAVYDTLAYPVVRHNIIDKFGKEVCLGADNVIKQNGELLFIDDTRIKTKLGFEVKAENIFVKNKDYYSEDYFIHKDLIITGKKQGIYMIWSSSSDRRFYNSYNENDFIFIDPDGFKNGLLYVIFYDNHYSSLSWGYINEKGEIVYRNRDKKYFQRGIKLNINYMEYRGFFNCIDKENNDLKQSNNPNEITLLLDSAVYEKTFDQWTFPPKRLCHSFKIINETQGDTLLFYDRLHEQIYVQAKDKNGVWRNIQTYIPSDVLSNTIHKLEPNKFWEFAIQSYSGGFKTKMRVVVKTHVKYKEDESEEDIVFTTEEGETIVIPKLKPIEEGVEKEFISNEIACEINASQFVRNQFSKDVTEGYPFEDYLFDRIISIP